MKQSISNQFNNGQTMGTRAHEIKLDILKTIESEVSHACKPEDVIDALFKHYQMEYLRLRGW